MYNSSSKEEGSLLIIVSEPLNNHKGKKIGKVKKRKKKGRKGGSIEIDL